MSHSIRRAVLLLLILLPSIPAARRAAGAAAGEERTIIRPEDVIDGAGMINYMQRPTFTVGSWVKYHVTGKSELGQKDDYTITILIGGEEVWWGEPCFWVETRTQKAGQHERYTASLVSYSAFGDSLAERHPMWFVRKIVNGVKQDGTPDLTLYSRARNEVQVRRAQWAKIDHPETIDSLGTETVQVAAGSFDSHKVRSRYVTAESAEKGDSTVYYRRQVDRVFYRTPKVPLTNLALIEIDDHQEGKTWQVGKFDQGPLHTLERARGRTELVGFGTSGVEALLVPKKSRGATIDRASINAQYDELNAENASSAKRRSDSR